MSQLPGRDEDKPRLIMVDDSKVMRTAARKMLGGRFDVVVAEDGLEGWNTIRRDQLIQVVFTDLSMPELDGYGLLEKIRTCEDPGVAGLPVIVVTGAENDEAAREKALQMGATDFISKPFNSTDLTARASAHANYQREKRQLEKQITIDALTGLGNKQFYNDRLKQDLAFAARHEHTLSVLRIDVDGFNKLFIRAGKEAADTLLKSVGKQIVSLMRKEDTAARIGLSQFAVTLQTADEKGARIFAERLCRQVAESEIVHDGQRLPVTVSIGVLCPAAHPGQTVRSVLEETAQVLKAAEQAGGNRVMTEGMVRSQGAELPSAPQPPGNPAPPRPLMTVDQALALIAEGKVEQVRPHLVTLKKQLMPLIKLLGSEKQE